MYNKRYNADTESNISLIECNRKKQAVTIIKPNRKTDQNSWRYDHCKLQGGK